MLPKRPERSEKKVEAFIEGPKSAKPKKPKMVKLRVDITEAEHAAIAELLGNPQMMSQHKYLQRAIRNQIKADKKNGGINV